MYAFRNVLTTLAVLSPCVSEEVRAIRLQLRNNPDELSYFYDRPADSGHRVKAYYSISDELKAIEYQPPKQNWKQGPGHEKPQSIFFPLEDIKSDAKKKIEVQYTDYFVRHGEKAYTLRISKEDTEKVTLLKGHTDQEKIGSAFDTKGSIKATETKTMGHADANIEKMIKDAKWTSGGASSEGTTQNSKSAKSAKDFNFDQLTEFGDTIRDEVTDKIDIDFSWCTNYHIFFFVIFVVIALGFFCKKCESKKRKQRMQWMKLLYYSSGILGVF